jgi:hypothetical protein
MIVWSLAGVSTLFIASRGEFSAKSASRAGRPAPAVTSEPERRA